MTTTTAPTKPAFQPPAPSAEYLATQKVAERLVELCRAGKNLDAIKDLYADNARQIESMEMPGCPRITEGKATLIQKAEKFGKTTTIHGSSYGKPLINGDQFVCEMSLDCTSNEGPMAGQRMNMSETALYTVKNGKITEAKFFYSCGM
ncbi:MAG TPA: nuclear transport factor 2 family protein [Phycisphaerales bacterium]|nr:nuclear transport factor 2 family protein [Phycisphaerales bacterium]